MMLVEETGVPETAIPVARFKEHLRLGTGFSDEGLQDPVLEGFLRAALAAIESRTGKVLIARAFSWTIGAWRMADRQALPVAPVQAVSEVALIDAAGVVVALPEAGWRLVQDMQRPLVATLGMAWPAVPQGGAARIRFTAGFGATFDALPADLQQAVLMLAAHYYEFRQDTKLGEGCMPFGVTALIERFRTIRMSGVGA